MDVNATTSTTTPSPEPAQATPAQETAPVTAQETPAEQAAPETPTVDIWAEIAKLDPEEVVQKVPRLQGKVGELADKQARQRQAQWEVQQERARLEREESNLLENDPDAFVERERQRRSDAARQTSLYSEVNASLDTFIRNLPSEVQQQIGGTTFNGTPAQYVPEVLRTVAELTGKHLSSKELEKALAARDAEWEKRLKGREREVGEAASKQALASVNGSEPTPDLGGGQASPSGPMGQAEFDRIRHDSAVRKANKARIDLGLAQGLIAY